MKDWQLSDYQYACAPPTLIGGNRGEVLPKDEWCPHYEYSIMCGNCGCKLPEKKRNWCHSTIFEHCDIYRLWKEPHA